MSGLRDLSRSQLGARRAPVRIIHLGLGNFHRAHQAWYTAHAADAAEWGIAAFTGRTPTMARLLDAQDSLYTLVVRGPEGDSVELMSPISRAHGGELLNVLRDYAARPEVAIITLTVTEAAYLLDGSGSPRWAAPQVAADIEAAVAGQPVSTPVGRLLVALEARFRAGGGPIAVVPCDNVPDNGAWLRAGTRAWAERIDPELAAWVADKVAFVSTSVDRITPRAGAEVSESVHAAGWNDHAPVVTEPYSAWVLQGEFPAGRPRWEAAGAVFVDDIEPYERRKLWLLNGAHSLLAAAGLNAGLTSVSEATGCTEVWQRVEAFWDEAAAHLPHDMGVADYRIALRERFANPRIRHPLSQIASDASTKLAVRIVPVALAERAAGRPATGCARAIAAWIDSLAVASDALDAQQERIDAALASAEPVRALLAIVSEDLASDANFLAAVLAATRTTTAAPAL
nr:mannitol dehydrogenase family protein [Demequina sp. NBRC 110051]